MCERCEQNEGRTFFVERFEMFQVETPFLAKTCLVENPSPILWEYPMEIERKSPLWRLDRALPRCERETICFNVKINLFAESVR